MLAHRGDTFYESAVVLGLLAFAVCMPLAWFLALPVIQLASTILHAVFGRSVPRALWHEATFSALWTLPIAAALGVATWLVYSIGEFGGWPDDVIFGAFGNLIGAWCCCTVFWNWRRLSRTRSHAA